MKGLVNFIILIGLLYVLEYYVCSRCDDLNCININNYYNYKYLYKIIIFYIILIILIIKNKVR